MQGCLAGDCPSKGDSFRLVANQDASVSEKASSSSFGHGKVLNLDAGGAPGTEQISYVMFDLTGVRLGSLGSSTLSFEVWGAQRGIEGLRPGHVEDLPLQIRKMEDSSWSEGSLTWNTRPKQGTIIAKPGIEGSVAVTAAGQALILSIDVTSEVGQTLMQGDGRSVKKLVFELSLKVDSGSHTVAGLYSREDGLARQPLLDITDERCLETHHQQSSGSHVFHQIEASEDSTVRGGAWSTVNLGRETLLSIHNGGGGDSYSSYIKFNIPDSLRNTKGMQIGRAEVRINKWRATPEHEADDIKVHMVHESFDEYSITDATKPKPGWAVLYCNKGALLMPNDMYLKIDLTDEFNDALKQSRRSFMIRLSRQEGKQALAGTAPLAFYSRESMTRGPVLSVQMLRLDGSSGDMDRGEYSGSTSDLW